LSVNIEPSGAAWLALAQVNRLIDQQAYMLAVNDVFYASSLIFLALIPLVWLSRPRLAGRAGAEV